MVVNIFKNDRHAPALSDQAYIEKANWFINSTLLLFEGAGSVKPELADLQEQGINYSELSLRFTIILNMMHFMWLLREVILACKYNNQNHIFKDMESVFDFV